MSEGIDTAGVAGTGHVDWHAYRAAGHPYAILRATYTDQSDTAFAGYWPALRQAGLVRGAYLFWRADHDPVRQAEAYVRTVGPLGPGDLPPMLDLEFSGALGRRGLGISIAACLDRFRRAARVLLDHYGAAMIYTSARVWRDDLGDAQLAADDPLLRCTLWLARYVPGPLPVPPPWGEGNAWIHQYRGNVSATHVPGFSRGNVDLNRFLDLSIGERGERVKWAQRRLHVTVDGVYGPQTQAAVVAFQRMASIPETGTVDVATFAYLAWAGV